MTPEQVVYRSHSPRVVVIRGDSGIRVDVDDTVWMPQNRNGTWSVSKRFDSWNEACRFAERWLTHFDRMRSFAFSEVQTLEAQVRALRKQQEQERERLKDKLRTDFNG